MPARSTLNLALARSLVLPGLLAAVGAQAAPAEGRYAGRFCVATSAGQATEPTCGPANVELRKAGQALIRISDMQYSLVPQGGRVDVVLKHGAMQIDGFSGPYEWKGSGPAATLHFVDADKGVRYEVHLGERRAQAR